MTDNIELVTDNQAIETVSEENGTAQDLTHDELDLEAQLEVEPSGEEEFIETEYNGKIYNLPKELKEALLRQSDYTKKTMDWAEKRKMVELQEQEIRQKIEKSNQEREAWLKDFDLASEAKALTKQLEQYDQIDRSKLQLQDKLELELEYRTLLDRRNSISHQLQVNEQTRLLEGQQNLAKLEAEASKKLLSEVKGWGAELKQELTTYVKALGAKDNDIENTRKYHPEQVKLLHKAYLYDKLVKQAAAKQIKPVTPTKKVNSSGKTTSAGLSDNDPVDVWLAKRNAQLRKQ